MGLLQRHAKGWLWHGRGMMLLLSSQSNAHWILVLKGSSSAQQLRSLVRKIGVLSVPYHGTSRKQEPHSMSI